MYFELVFVNASPEPIYNFVLDDFRAEQEDRHYTKWQVYVLAQGAPSQFNVVRPSERISIPVQPLSDQPGSALFNPLKTATYEATVSFTDARGHRWQRKGFDPPTRIRTTKG